MHTRVDRFIKLIVSSGDEVENSCLERLFEKKILKRNEVIEAHWTHSNGHLSVESVMVMLLLRYVRCYDICM